MAARARRFAAHVAGLTTTSLWASGSTYLLFAVFARSARTDELGRYVAVTSLVLIATQLLDGGSGLLMIRDVGQAGDEAAAEEFARRTLLRRARWLPVAGLVVLVLCHAVLHAGAAALTVTAFLLAGSSAYGFVVQLLQARRRFAALMAYQAANGLLFVAAAVAVLVSAGAPSLAAMLAGPAAALCVLGAIGLLRLPAAGSTSAAECADNSGAPSAGGENSAEVTAVRIGSVASSVTGSVDQVLLGAISLPVAAAYAGAQRAAIGIAAVSTALMSVLLPRVSGARAESHARLLRTSWLLLAPVVAGGAALGLACAPVLRLLYHHAALVPAPALALLMSAYAVGALSNLPVSVLYAQRRGGTVAGFALAQSAVVLAGSAAGAALRSATAVALAVALGRLLYYAGTGAAASGTLARSRARSSEPLPA